MNANISKEFWKRIQLKCDTDWAPREDERVRVMYDRVVSILKQGCGLTATRHDMSKPEPHRTVPSAGNIYPYDIFVAARDEENLLVIFKFCAFSNRLFVYNETAEEFETFMSELASSSDSTPETCDFAVLVLNRPWATIRKYGDRGLLYSFLDCAHAAVNIAYSGAQSCGYDPVVFGDVRSKKLHQMLETERSCSLVQSVICFPKTDDVNPRIDAKPLAKVLSRPTDCDVTESNKWRSLQQRGFLTASDATRSVQASSGLVWPIGEHHSSNTQIACDAALLERSPPSLVNENARRYSSNAFTKTPLKLSQLSQVIHHSEHPIRRNVPDDHEHAVGLRIVARHVEGAAGVFEYSSRDKALLEIRESVPDIDVRHACMNQKVVQNAAAILVLYAPIKEMLTTIALGGLKEFMFSAGQVGQMLYLSASAADVGVTAIGGFDTDLCRELACLSEEMDPVYVFALGHPDHSLEKFDRLYGSKYYAVALDQVHAG